jgi:hypothetical protein
MNLLITILTPTFGSLIIILHVLAVIYPIIRAIINLILWVVNTLIYGICLVVAFLSIKQKKEDCKKTTITPLSNENPFKRISLPMMSYPDCEACPCEDTALPQTPNTTVQSIDNTISSVNNSILADLNSISSYEAYIGSVTNPNDPSSASFLEGTRQIFAGYQNPSTNNNLNYLNKVPVTQYPLGASPVMGRDVQLAQSLNLANLRSRYFAGENYIKTTVRNTNPSTNAIDPSTTFDDSVVILLVDPNTPIVPGQLLSFTDITTINDPNITGLTNANQFNTNNITGATPFNSTNLVNKQFSWINPNGNIQTGTLKLNITENGKEYKFKAGVEYFQVITGATTTQLSASTHPTLGLLNKYLFKKTQDFTFGVAGVFQTQGVYPIDYLDLHEDMQIIILNRGVDPYTQKQNIRYDLSNLFGYSFGSGPIVEGTYYLNVPIQPNTGPTTSPLSYNWYSTYKTPQTHNVTGNTNTSLYHEPFGFTVDSTLFTAFTNNSIHYYSSTDKSQINFKAFNTDIYGLGNFTNNTGANDDFPNGNNRIAFQFYLSATTSTPQGLIEGGTFITSTVSGGTVYAYANSGVEARVLSPAYHLQSPSNVTITNNNRLVFRSDRLPTSTLTEISGNSSYALHLNNNFSIYTIDEQGNGVAVPFISSQATDTTGNAQDLTGDTSNGITDAVLGTLQCDNLTLLECYSGNGTSFGVDTPCPENLDGKRVKGGCYYFVDAPLITSIPKDLKYFVEWKSRFRMMFAACRGVFSQVFQNNWVNGSLYMFSFKKKTIFSVSGQPKKYLFCGSYDSILRTGQGPLFYTEGVTNAIFYRSTPYDGNNFLGQIPRRRLAPLTPFVNAGYGGMNTRNIYFPTTIMDLGPRDEFTRQICTNPQFEGYLIDTLQSTSYNDTSELLLLFILSRLINSNFWGQALGLGDASINRLFSRSEDRIDGDIAQLFSINSEFGVDGFSDDAYDDTSLYVSNTGEGLVGVFFTANTENRIKLTPGITTFTPTLTNYYGYPKTQEVPFYLWKLDDTNTIFGSDKNDWDTGLQGNGFYKYTYQTQSFYQAPFSNYFNTTNYGKKGYIYNSDSNGNTANFPPGQSNKFLVGAPFHFYFGLNKGKSSMNRYITKYIFNTNV